MSETPLRYIESQHDAPDGAFMIGIEKLGDTEYLFHVTLQLHNHPFPGVGTEELYSQVIPAAKDFDVESHTPTLHAQSVLDALGTANLQVPLFDYTKGVVINMSEQAQFSSLVQVHLESSGFGMLSFGMMRMTELLARTLNPQKPTYVVTISI
ncbi:MAG: hypothetical protein EOO17_05960 [Chloroflexi bacterium]|nr:MAG: hypothetical protein EOO17_05960 [Chloroflexota bacterium]